MKVLITFLQTVMVLLEKYGCEISTFDTKTSFPPLFEIEFCRPSHIVDSDFESNFYLCIPKQIHRNPESKLTMITATLNDLDDFYCMIPACITLSFNFPGFYKRIKLHQ
jgi:hypothetical protein